MLPDKHIWIFSLNARTAPGGVFSSRDAAETWIRARRLSGILTAFPIDEGSYDWAMRMDVVTGRAREQGDDAEFVATFSSACQDHYHYVDGEAPGQTLACGNCGEDSNTQQGSLGSFERWVCSSCRALRYWAVCCNQDWLVRARGPNKIERYVCEECETTFPVPLATEPVSNLTDWLRADGLDPLWTNIVTIPETAD